MDITITLPKTLSFSSGDTTYDVPTDTIPAASIVRLVAYGKRMFNDSVNGAIHAEKDKPSGEQRGRKAIADDWLAKLADGTLGTGGGGASRLSDLEKELRAQVHALMIRCGYKSGEATKLLSAHGASHAFRVYVAKPMGADDDKVQAAHDKLIEHASSVIRTRKAGPDLSAMFAEEDPA